MIYILDTNICVHILNTKSFSVLKHAKRKTTSEIYISSITEAELWFGVWKSLRLKENSETLTAFLELFPKLPFDSLSAEIYGELRAKQKKSGKNIGSNDLMIAAEALKRDGILVTNNTKEFKQIKDLRLENWLN